MVDENAVSKIHGQHPLDNLDSIEVTATSNVASVVMGAGAVAKLRGSMGA
jgi:hypothetical protein